MSHGSSIQKIDRWKDNSVYKVQVEGKYLDGILAI
jgi:hypothetical protein